MDKTVHNRKIRRCLALLCICALTLGCLGCTSPTTPQDAVAADWDECRLECGLLDAIEVELTTEEENALGSLIFNYPLRQITKEEFAQKEMTYGGLSYTVIFSKDNVMHHWSFGPRGITYSTTDHGTASELIFYDADRELLSLIDQFND